MANSIPLTFRAAPLPEGYKADPEQFKNDIVARLYAESTESISFFASGSVAPSSNVGPWLKNGTEWWVWSDDVADYIPQPIPQASLGYIAQNAPPDQAVYTIWIELNISGKAIAIKYYSGGAWKDVYEDTFAAIAASRAAGDAATLAAANSYTDSAVGGAVEAYPAQGTNSSPQSITANSTPAKIVLGTAPINPSPSPFDTANSRYVAPAAGIYGVAASSQFDNNTAVAADVEIQFGLYINNSNTGIGDTDGTPSPNGLRWSPSFSSIISLSSGDYVEIYVSVGDGVGSGNVTAGVGTARLSVWRIA